MAMQSTPDVNNSIELFCGTGGLALGLQRAGFQHKALYEWDKDSCDNIKANIAAGFDGINDWNVFQSDVRTVSYDGLTGKINMISGGPPCQPFSLGGKAQAYNDKRDMFPEAVRAVREIMPEVFIFENVKGLLRKSFSLYFSYIILQLTYPSIIKPEGMTWEEHRTLLEQHHTSNQHDDCEYNVVFRLFNAADYGVPQLRHRVIVIGFRKDVNAHWSFPNPTHSKESLIYSKWISGDYWKRHNKKMPQENPLNAQAMKKLRSLIEDCDNPLLPWRTTRDAIGDLPDPRSKEVGAFDNHIFRAGAKVYPGHSGSVLDEPSKTIKAGAHGVPGGENMLVLDSGEVRYYTVRESARIQTFPDNYRFVASWTESMRQIGNAVPVKLAEVVGSSVIAHLRGICHA
ncbi:MAG: DNA cytosine methyltransferase [Thermoguttaceae bacterium]